MCLLFSEIAICKSNFKKYYTRTYSHIFKVIAQGAHSSLPRMWKALNTASFTMCEFCSIRVTSILQDDWLITEIISPCVITVELTALYCSVYYILQMPYQLASILNLWYYHINVSEKRAAMTSYFSYFNLFQVAERTSFTDLN